MWECKQKQPNIYFQKVRSHGLHQRLPMRAHIFFSYMLAPSLCTFTTRKLSFRLLFFVILTSAQAKSSLQCHEITILELLVSVLLSFRKKKAKRKFLARNHVTKRQNRQSKMYNDGSHRLECSCISRRFYAVFERRITTPIIFARNYSQAMAKSKKQIRAQQTFVSLYAFLVIFPEYQNLMFQRCGFWP